jgi:hypothetical protein
MGRDDDESFVREFAQDGPDRGSTDCVFYAQGARGEVASGGSLPAVILARKSSKTSSRCVYITRDLS